MRSPFWKAVEQRLSGGRKDREDAAHLGCSNIPLDQMGPRPVGSFVSAARSAVNVLGSSSMPIDAAPNGERRCVFCLEEIRPGASVCPHCGSALAPLQRFADEHAALHGRIGAEPRPQAGRLPARLKDAGLRDELDQA